MMKIQRSGKPAHLSEQKIKELINDASKRNPFAPNAGISISNIYEIFERIRNEDLEDYYKAAWRIAKPMD